MKKTILTNAQVVERAKQVAKQIIQECPATQYRIYGIPRGGIPVAYLLAGILDAGQVVDDPYTANVIVDDLIDSGKTINAAIEEYGYGGVNYYALYDKRQAPDLGWMVFPWEQTKEQKDVSAHDAIERILQYLGEDIKRDGLKDTPNRVIKSYDELFAGYNQDPKDIFTTFESDSYDQIVLLKDIEMFSFCEHHMIPFIGRAHIAYIPDGKVIGISKLARLLEIYSRRLQIQERIGGQVTMDLMKHLSPKGAACIIEAKHLCIQMRGIQKQHSVMVTSSLKGAFLDNVAAREELMGLIK